jgi:hypothetical protein
MLTVYGTVATTAMRRRSLRSAFAVGEIEVRADFIEVTAGETVQHRGSAV